MKVYALNHTQNRAYEFCNKEEANVWFIKFTNNNGLAEIIDKKDNNQFLKVYKDKIVKIKMVQGLGDLAFLRG